MSLLGDGRGSNVSVAFHCMPSAQARCGLPQCCGIAFLIPFSFDLMVTWSSAGSYIDRVFKGRRPAELPGAKVGTIQLVINQNMAHAMFEVPPVLL